MSFRTQSGKTKFESCQVCGLQVLYNELIGGMRPPLWLPIPHDAPCGLSCLGGGITTSDVSQAELVHGSPNYPCPKCGEDLSITIQTFVNDDRTERVTIVRYKFAPMYRMDLYQLQEEAWTIRQRIAILSAKTDDEAVASVTRHIEWLSNR